MMFRAQFEEPQTPSVTALPGRFSAMQFGLLGNERIQEIAAPKSAFGEEVDWAWEPVLRTFTADRTQSKLALLKSERFKAEGREKRIRISLSALDAPQPTMLNLQQWMEVAEEIEDEDEA